MSGSRYPRANTSGFVLGRRNLRMQQDGVATFRANPDARLSEPGRECQGLVLW